MRKTTKLFGCGVVAALVAMLAVLPVAGASAAKSLALKFHEALVVSGSAGTTEIDVDGCALWSNGTVTTGAAKDVLKATASVEPECSGGKTVSGLISETQLTKSGKAVLKGAVTVATSEGCDYEFKNPKGTFTIPGFVVFSGKTKGKRTKTSPKTCAAKTEELSLSGVVTTEPFEEPFAVEVV